MITSPGSSSPVSRRQQNRLVNGARRASVLIFALSIILLQGRSLAFMIPVSSTRHRIRHDKISFTPASRTIQNKWPSLSMIAKSGGRLIVSTEQFEQEVLLVASTTQTEDPQKVPILVLFSAPWCGPCRLTNPVVKEIMKQYQAKLEVVEISTDDLPEVASNAGVLSIPTIQLYHGGKVMDTIVGCVAKNVLARAVDKVLEDLGMLEDEGNGIKTDKKEEESS